MEVRSCRHCINCTSLRTKGRVTLNCLELFFTGIDWAAQKVVKQFAEICPKYEKKK